MKNQGVSLIQYIIALSLISLGIIGAYSMLGQQIVSQLNQYLNLFQTNNEIIAANQNNNSQTITRRGNPSEGNGTSGEGPVSQCTNGICNIDFGEYILNGIPENFKDYTSINGASGGNDKIFSLYMQLADQLKTNGDPAGSEELKDLANLVSYMSSTQRHIEDTAQYCSIGNNVNNDCIEERLSNFPAVPAELRGMIDISTDKNPFFNTDIGVARNTFVDSKNTLPGDYPYNTPSLAFVNKYDEIVSNSKYSDTLKGILKELYMDTSDINHEIIGRVSSYFNDPYGARSSSTPVLMDDYDCLTGKINRSFTFLTRSLEEIIHPNMIKNQDIVSALKCASQNYQNAQTACHNK